MYSKRNDISRFGTDNKHWLGTTYKYLTLCQGCTHFCEPLHTAGFIALEFYCHFHCDINLFAFCHELLVHHKEQFFFSCKLSLNFLINIQINSLNISVTCYWVLTLIYHKNFHIRQFLILLFPPSHIFYITTNGKMTFLHIWCQNWPWKWHLWLPLEVSLFHFFRFKRPEMKQLL